MNTYKTKNGAQIGFVPGVGAFINGQITTDQKIENPNFELVTEAAPTEVINPVQATNEESN